MKRKIRKSDIGTFKGLYGQWVCYATVDGVYRHKQYFWYTKAEAIQEFYNQFA